jgi:tetrapyrrole methylase family protein/MazG family protein|tara:strand:+ start:143 stop:901 length:759 start_codon:yes stop_codon:yes gene_type:complete
MKEKFLELVKITKKLRSEDGCPWDKEQTFETLRSHIIEESYETISAIDMKDYDNLNEELGDLLLQILLVSNIAEEKKLFTIEDVIGELSKKLVRRHPHVFGNKSAKDANEAKEIWNREKMKEPNKDKVIPSKSFPSLIRAVDISKHYSKLTNLDWPSSTPLLEVLYEEINELKVGLENEDKSEIEEELGDILFTVANLCRKEGLSPEIALNQSSDKFTRRANLFVELKSKFEHLSDEELWSKAKLISKKTSK